MGSGVRWVPLY